MRQRQLSEQCYIVSENESKLIRQRRKTAIARFICLFNIVVRYQMQLLYIATNIVAYQEFNSIDITR